VQGSSDWTESPQVEEQIAAHLLDDLFDNDDEIESEAPAIVNNQFSFGAAVAFEAPSAPPHGRGRGRTMPALMQQQQQ